MSATQDWQWYAIQTRPRWEKAVSVHLAGKGYEPFLPLYPAKTDRRGRSDKDGGIPLFSGYLFCRLDVERRLPVLVTPGVVRIVGHGKTPEPVADAELDSIRRITESGHAFEPWRYIAAGERVRIEQGPLAGVEGLLVEFKNTRRVVVSVELLQRSVAVELDGDWICRAKSQWGHAVEPNDPAAGAGGILRPKQPAASLHHTGFAPVCFSWHPAG